MRLLLLGLSLALSVGTAHATSVEEAPAEPTSSTASDAENTYEGSAVHASLVLRVSDKKTAAEATIDRAKAAGGWFTHFEPTRVDIRVPTGRADAVLEDLSELGDIVDRSYRREDHSQELAQLEARIAGREKVLSRYREVLETSKAGSVVAVERQITQAIQELERLKGRRRYLDNRLEHATISVSFQFRDRTAPRRDGSSSFAWLNTMNMADLLWDLRNGERASRSRADAPTPAGFAAFRKRGRFQAVTPDDVVFRIRSARNKPKADLDFWKEALKERQEAAGYTVLGEQMMGDGETYVLSLGAANGPLDQTYVIGLRVHGRHLILAEATGESQAFQAHNAAILASVDEMR